MLMAQSKKAKTISGKFLVKTEMVKKSNQMKNVIRNWRLYALLALPLTWLIIFRYIPMTGVLMAFEDYSVRHGIFGSQWVGFKHFIDFFQTPNFKTLMVNTIGLSLYSLIAGFPIPIILALALNELSSVRIKKYVQTITFMPYFVSVVVLISILSQIFHVHYGIINIFLKSIGIEPMNIMGTSEAFRHMYVWTGVWQSAGYNAVLYIAALSSIGPELKEAATIDGASRFQKVCHIDFPGILPTIVITLILDLGHVMSVGFEKAYIMQTSANLTTSEIISTYVYKVGIQGAKYGYASAIGLYDSLINFMLIIIFNQICKRLGETSLW